MDPNIIIQTLVSIQGEGSGIGRPILLIRFAGCNLKCTFCDSSWTNNNELKYSIFSEENCKTPFKVLTSDIKDYVDYIYEVFLDKYNIETVLFTGGETFLNIDFIKDFINSCDSMDYFNTYEIETNGTLLHEHGDFIRDYKEKIQLNISPKPYEYFDRYGVGFKRTLKYITEDIFNSSYAIKNSFLKFVYSKEMEKSILSFIKKFNPSLPIYMSSLTPQNGSQNFIENYRNNCLDTLNFCLETGYRYSPREHVFLFGDNREEFESLA